MKRGTEFAVGLALLTIPAFALGFDVPSVEPISEFLKLILNWKTLGAAGAGVSIVLIVMEVLKRYLGDFKWKEAVAVVLSVVYTVLVAVVGGADLWQSAFTVLVVGGGAMKIYDAIKKAIEDKAPALTVVPPPQDAA